MRVNGAVIRTGNIEGTGTQIQDTLVLSAGTNQIECLLQGPENIDYVSPSCKKEIIPEIEPAGNCLPGDSVNNATLCTGDSVGIGIDISTLLVHECSESRKCEYTCNNGYVPFNGQCIPAATQGDVTVPGNIRPNIDYPLIQCQ